MATLLLFNLVLSGIGVGWCRKLLHIVWPPLSMICKGFWRQFLEWEAYYSHFKGLPACLKLENSPSSKLFHPENTLVKRY